MKLLLRLICAFVLLAATAGLFAASAPPPAQLPAPATVPPEPLPVSAPILPVSNLKFDDYINDLAGALKLSDDEKKAIVSFYQAGGTQLKTILDSNSISPLEKDREVSDLRAARNAKIEALLGSSDRMSAFLKIEARYRVALIELAGDGGLVPPAPTDSSAAPAPTTAPTSTPTPAAPVSARTPPPE